MPLPRRRRRSLRRSLRLRALRIRLPRFKRAVRGPLVGLEVAFGEIVPLVTGLACGASSVCAGPTVQVDASVPYAPGRLAPDRHQGLRVASSAGGTARRRPSRDDRPVPPAGADGPAP